MQAMAPEVIVNRVQRRLAVERVEHGLDHQQIGAAIDQPAHAFQITRHQFVEGDIAKSRIVHIRRHRRGAAGRAEHAGDEARLRRRLAG